MENTNNKISNDYLRGRYFTENLKQLLNCKNLQELSKLLDVPKSTFSTWNMNNRISYELVIRIHLDFNIPVKKLVFGYQSDTNEDNDSFIVEEQKVRYDSNDNIPIASDRETNIIPTYKLNNGELKNQHTILFDKNLLGSQSNVKIIALEDNKQLHIINTEIGKAINGRYLITIDELFSLNEIQRLPNNKLAIAFNKSTVVVDENNICVIGKVISDIKLH